MNVTTFASGKRLRDLRDAQGCLVGESLRPLPLCRSKETWRRRAGSRTLSRARSLGSILSRRLRSATARLAALCTRSIFRTSGSHRKHPRASCTAGAICLRRCARLLQDGQWHNRCDGRTQCSRGAGRDQPALARSPTRQDAGKRSSTRDVCRRRSGRSRSLDTRLWSRRAHRCAGRRRGAGEDDDRCDRGNLRRLQKTPCSSFLSL